MGRVSEVALGLFIAAMVATILVLNVDTSSNKGVSSQVVELSEVSRSVLRLSKAWNEALEATSSSNIKSSVDENKHIRRSWTQNELIENFPEIQAYLESVEATPKNLDDYVPRELVIEMNPELVRQSIGPAASKGYVAMSLYYLKNMTGWWNFNNSWTTNYLILVTLDGELKSMLPVTCCNGMTHFDALKPFDDKHFIIGGNYMNSESGHVYSWNWQENTLSDVSGFTTDAHDVQWSYFGDDSFYTPTDWGYARYEAYTGNNIENVIIFDPNDATDVNHAQLLHADETVLLSDRTYNRISLFNRTSKSIQWQCGGGSAGTLDLYDLNGNKLSSDSSLFYGQHNAEYFGNNEYYIFDNNYNSALSLDEQGKSRAIIVNIVPEENRAQLAWSYEFPGFSYVFGDNDRLPSSNILTTWWPYVITKDTDIYDVHAMEITHESKETAWSFKVLGAGCDFDDEDQCYRSIYQGWKIYSTERFYTEPLVYNAKCIDGTLTFDTHNTFKTNNPYPGYFKWETHDGTTVHPKTEFKFASYWRTTSLSFTSLVPVNGIKTKVTVANKVGQERTLDVKCYSS